MSYEDVMADANNLYNAYRNSIKGSKWKESTQRYMLNYLHNIFEIQDSIHDRTLENGTPRIFTLLERGHPRIISSLPMKDRVVRHVLCDDLLLPEVRKHIIYDNSASLKNRGISFSRNRLETHLKKYYKFYGNDGWIVLGDCYKFYDNIVHSIAKEQLLELFDHDEFMDWILSVVFDGFKVDVSYMTDEEYAHCMETPFSKLEYAKIPRNLLTGEKYMYKAIDIGDQLAQVIGIYYLNDIDTYVKYVEAEKFYGRYNDDWYLIGNDKDRLIYLTEQICSKLTNYGMYVNKKKIRMVRLSEPFKFLQIEYSLTNDGKVVKHINPKRLKTMRRKLRSLASMEHLGNREYMKIENDFRSWMGSNYKLMTKSQRKSMISLFEELFNKKITVVNKKLVVKNR